MSQSDQAAKKSTQCLHSAILIFFQELIREFLNPVVQVVIVSSSIPTAMSKKKETVQGWPAEEKYWRQWLLKNYGEFSFLLFWREPLIYWSGDRSEMVKHGAEIGP